MNVLVLNAREVQHLLTMDECIAAMEQALASVARGEALLPLRTITWLPGRTGALGLMPACLGQPAVLGVKAISVFPGNTASPYESHQGAVLLFEVANGRLLAAVDASSITAIRTAAVSAVATRHLARPDAGTLAILGTGVQARTHLEAMRRVRTVRQVRVWGRNPQRARDFAARQGRRHGLPVEAVAEAREAVAGADLVCTVTGSPEPVVEGAWLEAGAHVNAVGACLPTTRELDGEAVARCRLVVDRVESALHEAGDFLLARQEGKVDDGHILGELGNVILGKLAVRKSPEEITLFKSLGLAVEDLAAAHAVYRKAAETGRGARVDWGGERHADA